MQASIFRIELAMDGLIRRKRAEAGLPPDEPPAPDKAAVGNQLKQRLRAIGAVIRGRK